MIAGLLLASALAFALASASFLTWLLRQDVRARRGGVQASILATGLLIACTIVEYLHAGALGTGPRGLLLVALIGSCAFLAIYLLADVPLAGPTWAPMAAAIVLALGIRSLGGTEALVESGELGLVTGIHIGSTLLGFLLFLPAHVLALLFLDQEYHLRAKTRAPSALPSLMKLERSSWRLVYLGFPLFSLGILLGFVWQESVGPGVKMQPQHVFAALGWSIYAHATWRRLRTGWRGRRAALELIGAFVLTLVAVLLYTMR